MITLFIAIVVYVISIVGALNLMIMRDIQVGCLPILCVFLPIVNTIIFIIFIISYKNSKGSITSYILSHISDTLKDIFKIDRKESDEI